MRGRGGIVLAIALLIGSAAEATAGFASAHDCDHLAASPDDLDRPEGVDGVPYGDLRATDEAMTACKQAVAENPRERRFLTHLGRLYSKRGFHRAAIDVYTAAHAMGSAVAANNLGSMYSEGEGVPENQREAARYFRKAAHRGLPYSMYTMGDRARLGLGMDANMRLARYWYERAAEHGNARSLSNLGVIYRDGLEVRPDTDKAFAFFRKAMEADPAYALPVYHLARMYENGVGREPDMGEALQHYIIAFILGDADAAQEIGDFYLEGKGVEPDPVTALDWYRKGGDMGSAYAMNAVAWSYETGSGVEQDTEKARALYAKTLGMDPDDTLRDHAEERLRALGGPLSSQ